MFDELDDGARTGVWVTLGVVAFLLLGLLGGLVIRQITSAVAPATVIAAPPAAVFAAPAAAVVDLDALLDVPLAGDLAGTLLFDSTSAQPTADAPAVIAAIRSAADAVPARRLVVSGFHDASGDAAMNHDLAKRRAFAVRDALVAAGVARERIALRKPASTDGGGPDDPLSRRVEVHLVD